MSDDLRSALVDSSQIGQVLQNLYLNAIQAMPGGGTIEVAAENFDAAANETLPIVAGQYVKLAIRDHGVGIPKEQLKKIFDPYYTTKAEGQGLGLAIAFSIVNKHKGFIQVDSSPQTGTCFEVFLPAAE